MSSTGPRQPSRSQRRLRPIVAGVAASLLVTVVAGCGGSLSTSPASPATSTPVAAKPQGGGVQDQNAAEFGLSEKDIESRQIAVEDDIRTCMKNQGFDYVPVDPTGLRKAMDSNSKPSGLKADEFRKQFGYGLTTLYTQQVDQARASQGAPNKAIRDALARSDRTAYDRALYGDNAAATFAAALDSEDLTGLGGCTKQAVDKAFPANEVQQLRATGQDAVGDRALQDPRVVEATRKWSQCMRAAGFDTATPEAIKDDLRAKLAAIVGDTSRPAPVGSDPSAVTYDRAALAGLQQEELKLAAADDVCQAKGLKKIKTAVEAEIAKQLGG